ncbi:MAG: hypothetical protein AAB325_17120, partial [Pseudomonadota bacterium]
MDAIAAIKAKTFRLICILSITSGRPEAVCRDHTICRLYETQNIAQSSPHRGGVGVFGAIGALKPRPTAATYIGAQR